MNLARGLKPVEHEDDGDTNWNWCAKKGLKMLGIKTGHFKNQRKDRDYIMHNIVNNGGNTQKKIMHREKKKGKIRRRDRPINLNTTRLKNPISDEHHLSIFPPLYRLNVFFFFHFLFYFKSISCYHDLFLIFYLRCVKKIILKINSNFFAFFSNGWNSEIKVLIAEDATDYFRESKKRCSKETRGINEVLYIDM